MSLNRSPNIEWIHPSPARRFTLNPLGGWCLNGCDFCYRERVAARLSCAKCRANEPHEHPERLAALEAAPAGAGVFVCSMADLWSDGVESEWRRKVFRAIRKSQATCFVLTKRPDRIADEDFEQRCTPPPNLWLGTSITRQEELWRLDALYHWPGRRFVSFEPLLGPVDPFWAFDWPADWVILGGLSGSWLPEGYKTKAELRRDQKVWAEAIIRECRAAGIPVFVKTKPVRIPGLEAIQEWPAGIGG